MTDADAEMIAELERLSATRTRGEWRWQEEFVEEDGRTLRTLSPGVLIIDDMGGGPWGDDIDKTNAHFIVAAANAMPRLLALAKEAQSARAEAERLREALAPFAAAYLLNRIAADLSPTAIITGNVMLQWLDLRRAALAGAER